MDSEAGSMACFWFAVSAYNKFRSMPLEHLREIAETCSEFSLREPIWYMHDKRFELPYIDGRQTGLQTLAYFTVAMDIISGYQLTDRGLTRFEKWLRPARAFAEGRLSGASHCDSGEGADTAVEDGEAVSAAL